MIICVYLNPTIDKTLYFESFKQGATNRPKKVILDGAGKAINVAVVLKTLNKNPLVIGLICKDDGMIIKERLNENNIKYDFIEIEGRCRVNTKIFNETTREVTEINEKGAEVNSNILDQIKEKLYNTASSGDIVVMTGSLPQGCKDDLYAEMLAELNKKGVKCVLDADGSVLVKGIAEKPYFIKPNIDELSSVAETEITSLNMIFDAAKKILNSGIKMIGVSMGKDGAYLFTENDVFKAEPLNLDVKSTVGAGDSMVAGIVANIDDDPEKALKAGCAAASASITLEGTQLATPELYNQMFNILEVKKI